MKEKLSFFHATILIYMFQSGVAILGMPNLLANYFGTNGWLGIFLVSFIVSVNILLIWIVHRLGGSRSVYDILEQSVPKLVLFPVYLALAFLWAMLGCLTTKQYVLIFQMFSFPTTPPMALKLLMDILALLLISKGIYVIAKAATIFFWLIIWMLLLLLFFLGDFEWARLTPFVFKGGESILSGSLNLFFGYLGYELSLFIFPYTDRKTKFIKAVFIANIMITFVYLITCFVCFGFYSVDQLKTIQYPVIDIMSYIRLPFVQRVENLFYGFFMFTTLFSTVMYVWAAKEASRRIFPKTKPGVLEIIILTFVYFVGFIPDVMNEVRQWLQTLGHIQIGVAFGFPIIVILVLLLQRKKGEVADG